MCACGSKVDTQQAMNCKKGGSDIIRRNNVRDITINMLSDVRKDITSEPVLLQLTRETFVKKSTQISDESRLDIKARGFWVNGQNALYDIRVFDPNALRYFNQSLSKSYSSNEHEKKRHYNDKVFEVNGSFTPIVFSIYGGMAREILYYRLADMIAENKNLKLPIVTYWLRTKQYFLLLKSCVLCIKGSRTKQSNACSKIESGDISINYAMSKLN